MARSLPARMEEASRIIGIDSSECVYEGERFHHRLDTVPKGRDCEKNRISSLSGDRPCVVQVESRTMAAVAR
jgi:hypothetical protein